MMPPAMMLVMVVLMVSFVPIVVMMLNTQRNGSLEMKEFPIFEFKRPTSHRQQHKLSFY